MGGMQKRGINQKLCEKATLAGKKTLDF